MKNAIKKLFSGVKKADGALGLIAGFCILAITLVICYEIITRYVFHRPPIWAFDVCSYLLLVVAVFSGAFAMAEDGHINFTMVVEKLRPKARRVVLSVGSILGLIYCFFLLDESVKLAIMAVRRNIHTHDQLGIPDIYLYLIIIIGAFFLFATFLLKAIVETFYDEKGDYTSKEY